MSQAIMPRAEPKLTAGATATVDRITGAVLRLMAKQDSGSLNISEICREADVARPTFYRHFATMDELSDAVFQRVCDDFDKQVQHIVEEQPMPEQRIEVIARFLSNRIEQDVVKLMYVSRPEFGQELVDRYFDNRREVFEAALAPAFDLADSLSGRKVDRQLATDILLRYYISLGQHRSGSTPANSYDALKTLMQNLLFLNKAPTESQGT
jgi:AcrR family transcriptional regulator